MPTFSKPRDWAAPLLLVVSVPCVGQTPLPEPATDQETELGEAIYTQLKEKGEIVESSRRSTTWCGPLLAAATVPAQAIEVPEPGVAQGAQIPDLGGPIQAKERAASATGTWP